MSECGQYLASGMVRHYAQRILVRAPPGFVHCAVQSELGTEKIPDALSTWKARDSLWVTIGCDVSGQTCFSVGESDSVYLANENAALHPDCPRDTIMLGQVVFDPSPDKANALDPNIMVFDIARFGGQNVSELPPTTRYQILREQVTPFFVGRNMCLQWSGHYDAAVSFCQNKDNLPHSVEYVFSYARGGAGNICIHDFF